MVGLLLQWIILEQIANLQHAHIACWCDNTPTVAWATKLLATKATNAAQLLCILALQMLACQASLLTTSHIPGITNTMADFASHSFNDFPNEQTFLTEFHNRFPLLQQASWISCILLTATVGCTLHDVNTDIWAGIVAATQATCHHYWWHWTQFLPSNINPYLQNLAEAQ